MEKLANVDKALLEATFVVNCTTACFSFSLCYPAVQCLPKSVRPSSVPWPHLENKQDRPIVTMKHYIEVSTSDSETAFISSPDALPREIFCFQIKYVQILMRSPVRLWRQTATDCDRRNLFLTTIVRCVDNTCEGCDMMPKSA